MHAFTKGQPPFAVVGPICIVKHCRSRNSGCRAAFVCIMKSLVVAALRNFMLSHCGSDQMVCLNTNTLWSIRHNTQSYAFKIPEMRMCFVATPASPSCLPAIALLLPFHLKTSLCFKSVSHCLAIVTICLEIQLLKPLPDLSHCGVNIDGSKF